MEKNEQKKVQEQPKPAAQKEKRGSVSPGFRKAIKSYLDNRAKSDDLFAQTYAKENKSIDECCNYIIGQVKASGRCGFADEEIYGMAVHYYDEDSIKDVEPVKAERVVVNHTIELSESEKQELRQQAEEEFKEEQLRSLRQAELRQQEKEQKAREARLRKAQEEAERRKGTQLSLFDM
jgi:antitoxin component YwqK of YwqJK toxin-antitoxin module